jgi:hypothetical protein
MTENINESLLEELDSSWIEEFENLDREYKSYYTEDISFIRFHAIYINKEDEIEKVREEKILLKTPGLISRDELLGLIKRNTYSNNIKYFLLSILKFNIGIEPIHLKNFLRHKNIHIGNHFLQSIKHIDGIKFEKSISMFHDLNDLLIVFHEKNHNFLQYDNLKRHEQIVKTNYTKKIFIHSNTNKKTRRKQFKDKLL